MIPSAFPSLQQLMIPRWKEVTANTVQKRTSVGKRYLMVQIDNIKRDDICAKESFIFFIYFFICSGVS